jgi:hypothetical protein
LKKSSAVISLRGTNIVIPSYSRFVVLVHLVARVVRNITKEYRLPHVKLPTHTDTRIYCFICYKYFLTWNSYGRHYAGHNRRNPESTEVDSLYWEIQLEEFMAFYSHEQLAAKYNEYIRAQKSRKAERDQETRKHHRLGRGE